jgi:hypothetical protein
MSYARSRLGNGKSPKCITEKKLKMFAVGQVKDVFHYTYIAHAVPDMDWKEHFVLILRRKMRSKKAVNMWF